MAIYISYHVDREFGYFEWLSRSVYQNKEKIIDFNVFATDFLVFENW
jgi:hypothetical protein